MNLLSVCILYSILTVMYNPLFLMGTYTSIYIILMVIFLFECEEGTDSNISLFEEKEIYKYMVNMFFILSSDRITVIDCPLLAKTGCQLGQQSPIDRSHKHLGICFHDWSF